MTKELSKKKVVLKRPDGVLVHDIPSERSSGYSRGLKKGDKVTGAYHDIMGRYMRIRGVIIGFARNDVAIQDKQRTIYFIDGKNVFK